MTTGPDNLTPQEAAAKLRVSAKTVLRLIEGGLLPAVNVGAGIVGRYRIARVDLDGFLDGRQTIASRRGPKPRRLPSAAPRRWAGSGGSLDLLTTVTQPPRP